MLRPISMNRRLLLYLTFESERVGTSTYGSRFRPASSTTPSASSSEPFHGFRVTGIQFGCHELRKEGGEPQINTDNDGTKMASIGKSLNLDFRLAEVDQ